jgi:hypothetical protein
MLIREAGKRPLKVARAARARPRFCGDQRNRPDGFTPTSAYLGPPPFCSPCSSASANAASPGVNGAELFKPAAAGRLEDMNARDVQAERPEQ